MNQDILVLIEHLQGKVLDMSYIMLAAGHELASSTGGRLIALLLGNDAKSLADDLLADEVHYLDHPALGEFSPEAYIHALVGYLSSNQYRALILGHTSIGMDIAGGLSIRLELPAVSQCHQLGPGEKFTSQICGGKIFVEGDLPAPTTIITLIPGGYRPESGQSDRSPKVLDHPTLEMAKLRIEFKSYIEPETEDIDITKEDFLVAVGRGLQNQDDMDLANQLAQALGGAVCASRPVVDKGWLPATRLVGKSGLRIKPKTYLALGISGAPEHVEAITESDLIIAVNTDPFAPIFDIAQYGAEVDMGDLLPKMIEQLQQGQ
ncbi:MAG: electron transfer flavoprotein subunit alpha/FixB family protein [Anaerolineae bacterium]|nr:electron transfer flavoprotein subunit alpha/FixB family protein [Anaerolineae bacterium]